VLTAQRRIDVLGGAVAGLPEDQRELAGLVDPALRSEHLLWGIVEPVRLYGSALELHLDGGDPQEVGEHLRAGIEAWAPRMPLDPVWASLTAAEVRSELGLLEHTLLRSPQASANFRGRLTSEYRVTAIDRLVDERTT